MDLFRDEADLLESGFLFRITDNGGETYDRITVTFCDGDYILCTLGSICAHGESGDVQVDSDAVEAGTARDLRWIDLEPGLRRRIVADLNEGFRDWLEAAPAAANRDAARNWQGLWREAFYSESESETIYTAPDGKFYIRDDDRCPPYGDEGDPGPFESFRDAVRYMLPQDYDLSGPEYHSTVDLADETGGPAEPWDSEADPATPYEVQPWAIASDKEPRFLPVIAEARDPEHAAEIAAEWREANPELAREYQPAYINKVERVVHRID